MTCFSRPLYPMGATSEEIRTEFHIYVYSVGDFRISKIHRNRHKSVQGKGITLINRKEDARDSVVGDLRIGEEFTRAIHGQSIDDTLLGWGNNAWHGKSTISNDTDRFIVRADDSERIRKPKQKQTPQTKDAGENKDDEKKQKAKKGMKKILEELDGILEDANISDFKEKRIAVDAYAIIYKGLSRYGGRDLVIHNLPTTRHFQVMRDYFLGWVSLGLTVILVFEGNSLLMKEAENTRRSNKRKKKLEQARNQVNEAKADKLYGKSIKVTTKMAKECIRYLEDEGFTFDCIFAPYEADPQLAYLLNNKKVDLIVTDDVDLIVYGCHTVLLNLNFVDGSCKLFKREKLLGLDKGFYDFTRFTTFIQIIAMTTLLGCDFLPAVVNVNMESCYSAVVDNEDWKKALERLKGQVSEGTWNIFNGYENYQTLFQNCMEIFQYARVYDPDSEEMVCLDSMKRQGSAHLGPLLSDTLTHRIARGWVDAITKEEIP